MADMHDVKFYQEAAAAFRAASRYPRGKSSPYLLAMAEHYDNKAASLDRPVAGDKPDAVEPAANR